MTLILPNMLLGVTVVEASAIAQVDGDLTRGGLPVPRMTTTQRDAISAPAAGLLVYNTTTNAYNFYSGAAWVAIGSSGGGAPADATYITQTPSAGLSAEQALSLLATGLMQVTTTTGVVTSVATSAGIAALISDETGTGALTFATQPTFSKAIAVANATDPTVAMQTITAYPLSAATITNKELTSNVATITTSAAHGLTTGQTVFIQSSDSIFNGTFVITGTPLTTTFTYAVTHANVASAAATGSVTLVHTPLLTMTDTQDVVKLALDSRGHIAFGLTAPGNTNVVRISETVADPASAIGGLNITMTATLSAANTINTINGIAITATLNQGANNASIAAPGANRANTSIASITGSSGTVTAASAYIGQVTLSGGGTLSAGYDFYALAPTNSASTLTGFAAFISPAQTVASNNTYLLLGTATIPSGSWGIYVTSANDNALAGKLAVGRNATPLATLDAQVSDSGTNTVIEVAAFVRNSSGTPAAALGGDIGLYLKSSTTADTLAGMDEWLWDVATHASRASRRKHSVYSVTTKQPYLDAIAVSTGVKIGLYGVAPTAQAAAPTTALTTITFTSPGTPDYAIATVQLAGYGFSTQDEGNTVLSVIANLQARVNQLATALVNLGVTA